MDGNSVALAMSRGLSAVCATCKKYWAARAQGVPGDACLTKIRCGSPIAGDAFSDYEGPLQDNLSAWCFVCAKPSEFGIRVTGLLRVVGACKTHVAFMGQYRAVGGPTAEVELQDSQGVVPPAPPPKKDLLRAIAESEQQYAEAAEAEE